MFCQSYFVSWHQNDYLKCEVIIVETIEYISSYVAKKPDEKGYIIYTAEENNTWKTLYERQLKVVQARACDEYLAGIEKLALTQDKIPQLPEVNKKLSVLTGWTVQPVAALISARAFFMLLANRQFPAATFIRTVEELNYVKEPDIFHELFGHCPMLTEPVFADFVQEYAQFVLNCPEKEWPLLQRLFWFTVEFGLILTKKGLRIYGGGILSSIGETTYSVESNLPQRQLFNPLVALRTPYRIDEMQRIYFVIQNYDELYQFAKHNIQTTLDQAHALGEFPPLFFPESGNPSIHIHAC
jgi:phenylalanine-4-hydroxylase